MTCEWSVSISDDLCNDLHFKDHDNDGDDTEQVHLWLGLVRVDRLVRLVPPGKMSGRT